ncbi:MAG: hypothetical protein JWM65_2009 [Sphingomonas bacterium]|nr:hypothetical protein [Sphingomonas bacterium]
MNACPCCRNLTLRDGYDFEVCPVCFWEEDGQGDADADEIRGGPNGALSLTQARQNYRKIGACDTRFLTNVRSPQPDEIPD